MTITGDQSLLREINLMAIARAVQRQPGLSRADLAKETGLTKSTIGLLVQDLVEKGWLLESDIQATGAIGRRPTPLFMDGVRMAMIGADVSQDLSLADHGCDCHDPDAEHAGAVGASPQPGPAVD